MNNLELKKKYIKYKIKYIKLKGGTGNISSKNNKFFKNTYFFKPEELNDDEVLNDWIQTDNYRNFLLWIDKQPGGAVNNVKNIAELAINQIFPKSPEIYVDCLDI